MVFNLYAAVVKLLKILQKTMRFLLLFSLLLASSCSFGQISARVIRVKDGDTFVGLWNGQNYDCRLVHVDAPEIKQAYGVSSRDSLSKLILGKMVAIDSIKSDLYGRVLVDVRLGNIRLDSLLIVKGWAWHYAAYSSDAMLADRMVYACIQGVGLWRCSKSIVCPPWVYRGSMPAISESIVQTVHFNQYSNLI